MPGLFIIGGNNDGHVGQHFHHPDVFQDLVRRAVFAQSQSGMRSTNLHVFLEYAMLWRIWS